MRLQRRGRIVTVGGQTLVRFTAGCDAADGGCGGCWAGRRCRDIPLHALDGAADAVVGDVVVLEAAGPGLTRVALRLFGGPLAALLVGAWLGERTAGLVALPADIASALIGVCCFVLAWLITARGGASMIGMMALTVRRQRMDR